MMFPSKIQNAVDAPADFTNTFTGKVESIGITLRELIQVPIAHKKDMNYANGQSLCFGLDADGHAMSRETALYEIYVYISSKGELFAFHFLIRVKLNEWRPIEEAELPHGSSDLIFRVNEQLETLGYERVPKAELAKEVPGQFTEMDGAPASLFDVLFSELT
jgi:hypothetical protein